MRKLLLLGCMLASSTTSFAASFAGVANGVWNTGVNSSNVVLSGGAVDPNYTLIKLPAGCATAGVANGLNCSENGNLNNPFGPASYVVLENGFPMPPWLANTTTSKWLGPKANQTDTQVGGTTFADVEVFASSTDFFVYRMVFNLTALNLNPATAALSLRWASDNNGIPGSNPALDSHIRMCGVSSASDPVCGTAPVAGSTSQGFASWTGPVNINSGFTSGLMALDFVVYNSPLIAPNDNPSGFRVEILSATANSSDIPEPSTFALIGGALAGLVALRRRS
jgi:hypothetical protein